MCYILLRLHAALPKLLQRSLPLTQCLDTVLMGAQDEGPATNDDEDEGENWDVNRPADINLPSPERVDKVSKGWNIAEDTWKGGKSAKKAPPSAKKLAAAAQLTKVQESMEGEVTAAPTAGERPQRKRKTTTS